MEILNLNGNDIGCSDLSLTVNNFLSNSDVANTLNSLLTQFQNMKELYLSDCRINLITCENINYEQIENSWCIFFNSLKSSFLSILFVFIALIND